MSVSHISDIVDAVCHTTLLTHGYIDKLLIRHMTPFMDPNR